MNNDDIKFLKAETYPIDHQNSGEWYISLEFSNAKHFEEITEDNINKSLAIILDNEVKMAPRINQKISQARAQITGSFTKEEAKDIENRFSTFKMLENKDSGDEDEDWGDDW